MFGKHNSVNVVLKSDLPGVVSIKCMLDRLAVLKCIKIREGVEGFLKMYCIWRQVI